MRMRWLTVGIVSALAAATITTAAAQALPADGQIDAAVPAAAHVVVVIEENHSYADVIGSSAAPYINSLADSGASFTQSHGVTHPSEPNYLAMFAGSTFGLASDACPLSESGANLGSELLDAGQSFAGYSEDLPSVGYTGCTSGDYARKHAPWVDFSNVPGSAGQPFSAFPANYDSLPAVSFVVPNLANDMHDGSVQTGDSWLQANLSGYATWAQSHNSLLIVTWDEDDFSSANQIPTIITGQSVAPGQYSESVNHYNVLRTIEDMYGLPAAGSSADASPITDVWK